MTRFLTQVVLTMTMTLATANGSTVTALPDSLSASSMRLIGEGEFRFIGFHLYDASYWTDDDGAQALKIVYRKNIPGRALNKQMIDEWKRLGSATPAKRSAWASQTAGIWPDVSPGSELIATVIAGSHTEFFDGAGNSLGRIDDADFGPAFLDIWLDPRTRARKLRSDLIGNGADRIRADART